MASLSDFTRCVAELVNSNRREPHWEPGEAQQYMEAVAARRERFAVLAAALIDTVVRPRLDVLAGSFVNARIPDDKQVGQCECWFGYCERFPASTRVALSVEHDVRIEKLSIRFEVSMMPVFFKLNEHERLSLALDEVNDGAVADWVEERLLEFLEAYLRIDRGRGDGDDETVTDPVCGMRIGRSTARTNSSYRGHPYFFCSDDCRARFEKRPTEYVEVKPI